MPYVAGQARAIALDLVGMGQSGKSGNGYRYGSHYDYLEAFIDALELKDITFVVHDWGATLGFDYARQHPGRVKRIAFMEGVLPPIFPQPSFEAMGEEMGEMFRAFKDPIKGRELVIDQHMFVEQMLPGFVNRPLGARAMEAYRKPYVHPVDREPLLVWPREIPIAGEPKDLVERMAAIKAFMTTTDTPMLLLYAEPGVLVSPQLVPWYTQNIPRIETAFIGQGLHFLQEDQPDAIGRALADWLRRS
jgi:haloalkane dehalogenase